MTHKLKTLGLALMAVFTLTAMGTSTASAKQATIIGGPAVLGHDTAGSNTEFTGAFGLKCNTATYPGTASGSTIEVGLELSGCKAGGVLWATFMPEGCKYVLTLGTLVSSTHASVSAVHLLCPPGQQITAHAYTDMGHTVKNCTFEIPGQTPTVDPGLTISDQGNGHLRIIGRLVNITNYVAPGTDTTPPGKDCVPATTQVPNAILHLDITVTGGVGLE